MENTNNNSMQAMLNGMGAMMNTQRKQDFVNFKVYTGTQENEIWLCNISCTPDAGQQKGTIDTTVVLLDNLVQLGAISHYRRQEEATKREVPNAESMSAVFANLNPSS